MARIHHPEFSLPSIIAIISAIVSLFVGAGWGFLLALVAIVMGAIGILLAISPSVRGGIISFLSIFAGFLGIIVALIKMLT